ncbi:MAG: response regulator [Candidatus Cloacimonetes bacterium]|nr:response regulator [Candidatus Cloacimonadota bacterium]
MNKKRILIVEDERLIAEDIKNTLIVLNYDVIGIISNGEDVIKRIDKLHPDMILMDIMLEGELNGIETSAYIKKKHDIPIIYLTAYANDTIINEAKFTDPFGYVIKPFQEKELHAAIEMAFYKHSTDSILKESEKKYRTLFNNIGDSIFIFSKKDNRFLDCNLTALSVYGYSKDELKEMTIFDLHPPEEKKIVENHLSSRELKELFIFTHLKKNGESIVVDILTNDIIYEEDPAWLVIVHDISLRKKFEEKLQTTISRLSVIFKNVSNITLYEMNGSRRFISENILNLIGYPADIFIKNKHKFNDLMHQQDRNIVRDKILNWRKNGAKEMLTLWYRIKSAKGLDIWIEDRMVLISPKFGKKYITGILIDNSELKKAEEELKKSESRYKAVVEDQTEYINRFMEDGTLTFVNEAYCRLTQKTSAELVDANWISELAKEKQQFFKKFFKELSIKNPMKTLEFKKDLADGEEQWFEWTYRAIFNEKDEIIEYQSVGKDITARKKAEEEGEKIKDQLHQSQKMELIGRLTGGIAHDFNNLLTAINGYIEVARSKLPPDHPALTDIEVIANCGNKARNLIKQLLGFSRKQIIEQKITDLNSIVIDLNKMLKRLIGNEIEFITITDKKECIVKVDPGQIEQVIINLVVNARDALPDGGKIILKTSNEYISERIGNELDFNNPGNYVLVSVEDNGIGMSKKVREKMFDPFFTTKEIDKGTGLGLATVFGIIKQNNGNIFVESEEGKGSIFKIYLHQIEEKIEEKKAEKKDIDELPKGNETILLVEDENDIRHFITTILEEQGYNILEADNGKEGLKKSKKYKETIHLLLSDIRMPKMSGPELSLKIRSNHPETKILFISGHTDDDEIRNNISDLKAGFLQKPFSFSSLVTKVREILDAD